MPLVLLLWCIALAVGPFGAHALAQQTANPNDPNNQSWGSSISSGFKRGFDKLGGVLNPNKQNHKQTPEDDAVSLKGKGKPGPELYVAFARMYEQSSKWGDAEQQYQAALNLKDDYLPALLGYAQLKERLGQPAEALQYYQKAAQKYPQEASVHNNMGMCYARQGRLDEAAAAMSAAVRLSPKTPLYRNNFATVLVDQGKLREAFAQLREVHGEAAAYYNMGYLLNKKGQTLAATQHFALALRSDPSMTSARRWIDYLQKNTTQARLPQHPAAGGLRITNEKALPKPADEAAPVHLPPTTSREADVEGPALPGITYTRDERPAATAPTAPLPPPIADSDIQPLPEVR